MVNLTATYIDVLSDETPLLDEMAWFVVAAACPLPPPLPLALFVATAPVAPVVAAFVAAFAGPTPKMKR